MTERGLAEHATPADQLQKRDGLFEVPLLLRHQRQSPFGQHIAGVAVENVPQPAVRLFVPAREVVEQGAVGLERE